MISERVFFSPATVVLIRGTGCFGRGACGGPNTVVYQGYCGCWGFTCLNCGSVAHSSCSGSFEDEHWEEFEDAAQALN